MAGLRIVKAGTADKPKKGDRRRAFGRSAKILEKPKWPSIERKGDIDIQISRLKDSDLFTIRNFFTPSESRFFIKAAESIGFIHQGSLGPQKGEAYRDNDRISLEDHDLANAIWESGLSKLFADIKIKGKAAVGLNPNIRFYRYKLGQHFGKHIDESVDLGDGKFTYYTLLIYLNGNPKFQMTNISKNLSSGSLSDEHLVGGETIFYNSKSHPVAKVAPSEGLALLHLHGDDCLLHEARKVVLGVKYVLRSDVAFA